MQNKIKCILGILLLSMVSLVHAELNIEITHGFAEAVPIAITSFDGPKISQRSPYSGAPFDLAEVIRNDLSTSGRFRPLGDDAPVISKTPTEGELHQWQSMGVENLVFGNIQPTGDNRYTVTFQLWDVFKAPKSGSISVQEGELLASGARVNHVLVSKSYHNVTGDALRGLAHHISDVVFETLTGIKGAFSTRIAYVIVRPKANPAARSKEEFILEVADMDGYNPKTLVVSTEPIMSPAWSPDGKRLAFVSFEKKRSEIYLIDIATGKRQLLSQFPGINGAPAWSPDGKKLALVLSKDGQPKIYVMDISTKKLTQITNGSSIDTEPTWTPDGQALYFTSNRGGKPQIYKVALSNGTTERVTFVGNYNARPSLSADGKKIVMLHRGGDGAFRIAAQDLLSGEVRVLTQADLDESPSIAPNGAMVLYGTTASGKRVLGVVTIDGRGQLRLPAREGSVQEPAWSPFLS